MRIREWLATLRGRGGDRQDAEELRALFEHRYHHFKLLLTANNETHEAIAEIETALHGFEPYGMHFVREVTTRTSASVFQMIRNLDELAPGRYGGLEPRFEDIRRAIQDHTQPAGRANGGPLILRLEEVRLEHRGLVGPKMARLGQAHNELGARVPPGFVITTEAYRTFFAEQRAEIDRRIQAGRESPDGSVGRLSETLTELIRRISLPPELQAAILGAFDRLEEEVGGPLRVSVRSSASSEDLVGASFAGQYRSLLNVGREGLVEAYREVLASMYSDQAMAYRLRKGSREEDVSMAIGCMAMVDASCGGVAYSRNPVDEEDHCVSIHTTLGLPKGVVDGATVGDRYRVCREHPPRVVERLVADKADKFVCCRERGTRVAAVTEEKRHEACLSEDLALEVARQALALEEHFGSPQDVEWAIDGDGRLQLLQCRPLSLFVSPRRSSRHPGDADVLLRGGSTVSRGIASGEVHVVRHDSDEAACPAGSVLVLDQPAPRRALLLNGAVAVVSELGGAAGHLASVAREYGIPAIFGAEEATSRLAQGMTVTVDADERVVYDGRVESLIEPRPQRERPMQGSPVEAALEGASRYIVPLNLLDPDAPDFRPRHCTTYHDIMRFCHENAVKEMFAFDEGRRFPLRGARQLTSGERQQFWVLDLDDGFSREGRERGDRLVAIDQIRSIPMLALWEGMMAFPWEGPPPVNPRGLLSVMFEATANPDLDPARGSQYASKNYFMIARRFCSLQSRFGFHFCGAEALVGSRRRENYSAFQFAGGAATLERRIRRARFIGEILEESGFRVNVRQDSVTARLEGFEQPQMERSLRVIGYLIIHTRQLDMIMGDRDAIAARRAKIDAHLRTFEGTG